MYIVSISGTGTLTVQERIKRAAIEGDIVELRLDLMENVHLPSLLARDDVSLLVTCRSAAEGGNSNEDWASIQRHLAMAVHLGADYVDVERAMPRPLREGLLRNRGRSRVIISSHLRRETPGEKALSELLRDMAADGPDIVKIVTTAGGIADNFRILSLIPEAAKLGIPIIAFAMGPLGRVSRLLCVPMGAFATFACLDADSKAAPGQLPVRRMREITETLLNGN